MRVYRFLLVFLTLAQSSLLFPGKLLAQDTTEEAFADSLDVVGSSEVMAPFLAYLEEVVDSVIPPDGYTVGYLNALYDYAQVESASLYDEELFPDIPGQAGVQDSCGCQSRRALYGWLFSMALSEICTERYNDIYRVGFSLAGDEQSPLTLNMEDNPYIARLIASLLYVRFRISAEDYVKNASAELMSLNEENPLGCISEPIALPLPTTKYEAGSVFPDGTLFMPPASRNDSTNSFFEFDKAIMEYVKDHYRLTPQCEEFERAWQALEDCNYYAVYQKVIFEQAGVPILPATYELVDKVLFYGTWVTRTMKDGYDPQLGEYLPGYSENGAERADTEFRQRPYHYYGIDPLITWNDYIALCYPTYTPDNYPISQLIESGKASSSYPSSHSSTEWNLALVLVNVMPDMYRHIAKRAFRFAQNRVISRYHWYSDVLFGCTMGTTVIPRLYNYQAYRSLVSKATFEKRKSEEESFIKKVAAYILGERADDFDFERADVVRDGTINAADLVRLIEDYNRLSPSMY